MTDSPQRVLCNRFRYVLIWGLLSSAPSPVTAEFQTNPTPDLVQSHQNIESAEPDEQEDKEERKKAVTVGFSLLFLVSLVGVTLAIAVVLWGGRLRRRTRTRLSKRTIEDPLWYLKPNKKSVSTESIESNTPKPENRENGSM